MPYTDTNPHRDVILKYKDRYPDYSNAKLARIIIEEENFDYSIDSFRRAVAAVVDKPEIVQYTPKVLLFDIETSPLVAFTWTLFKPRLSHDNIINDWHIISWVGKWLYHDECFGDVLTPKEARSHDDKRVVTSLWKALNEADVVIGHNGDKFDLRKSNARFLYHKLPPPLPYQSIDTLKVSQRQFAQTSHRLDYLGQLLLKKGKIETDFELWKKCWSGDQEALDYMYKYNKEDVFLLEEVYMELRQWVRSHPNFGVHCESTESVCPTCGSSDIMYGGWYNTPANRYQAFRCNNCGAPGRQRKTSLNKLVKDVLVTTTAR